MDNRFANTPEPPYYAVLFTPLQQLDAPGYAQMAQKMVELAALEPDFLGIESTRGTDGLGITISYWRSEAGIAAWKQKTEHLAAQKLGMERWYEHYELRVAKVERTYRGPAGRPSL